MANRRVELKGRGEITLSPNDHLATGGEGSVYKKGDTIIKVYTDPNKMRSDGMAEKVKLLSVINHPYIVAPREVVLDDKGNEIGFYMPYGSGEPLSRVFTTEFRTLQGMNDKDSSTLVDRMREVVSVAHQHNAVMVDANELNWLAAFEKNGPIPRVIDVDSWAIGRWPAKVIMPSIRDWNAAVFDEKSDWFAWGVVSFQVYTGIHPYKGTLDGYKPSELEKRMRNRASVFTPGVRLNRAVRDFSCIPPVLRNWYEATFQKGERVKPPSPFDTTAVTTKTATVARTVITATGKLNFEKLFEKTNDPVIRVFSCGVVLLDSGSLIDLNTKREIGKSKIRDCEVVKVERGWLIASKDGDSFSFLYIDGTSLKAETLTLTLSGRQLIRYEDRLFIVTESGLTELSVKFFARPILSAGTTWGVMVNSTRWFNGVGVQDALGATFLIAPFSDKACAQVRVRELDGLKVVAAKSGNRFVTVIAIDKKGDYRKFELTFDEGYTTYKMWQNGTQSPELNISILPRRVCATIIDDGELVIFVPSDGKVTKVADKTITTDMALTNLGDTVVYVADGVLWKVSMRK